MKGYSPNYIRHYHPIKQRLKAIWHIITDRNFILITNIRKYVVDDEVRGKATVMARTDFDALSDISTCLNAAKNFEKYLK